MKARLLKKIRKEARNKINIYGVHKSDGKITGMTIGYSDEDYSEIFTYGDTIDNVNIRAAQIYYTNNRKWIMTEFFKYSRKGNIENNIKWEIINVDDYGLVMGNYCGITISKKFNNKSFWKHIDRSKRKIIRKFKKL